MASDDEDKTLRDEIERRAYQRFCDRGCQSGSDLDDWLAAELEVLAEIERAKPDEPGVASPNPKTRRKRVARR